MSFGYIKDYDFYNMTAEKYWAPTKNLNLKDLVTNAIQSGDYIGSRKVDGHWYMMIKDEHGDVSLRPRTESKNGGYINKIDWVPHLKNIFGDLPRGTVLLGEIYFPEKEGSRNVTTIMGCLPEKAVARQRDGNKLHYYVFDILSWNGEILLDYPLETRLSYFKKLKIFLKNYPTHEIEIAKFYEGERLLDYIDYCLSKGWEGVVLQKRKGVYEPGKRPARKSIKVKKEIANEIDCFLTGNYKPSTWEYTGKGIETWNYWWNDKEMKKIEGHYYLDFLDGAPISPITKGAFYGWAGAVEIGVLNGETVVPIGWISNVTEDIKKGIIEENSPLVHQVCKVSAMLIEKDTHALRHGRILEWRNDISWRDCEYSKVFGE